LFIEKENNLQYLQAIKVSVGVNNIAINTPGTLPAVLSKEADEDLAEVINNEDKNENNLPKSKSTATNSKHTSENKSNAKGYKHIGIFFVIYTVMMDYQECERKPRSLVFI